MKDMNQPTTYIKLTQDELGYIIDALGFTAAMMDGEDDTMEFIHSKGLPVMLPLKSFTDRIAKAGDGGKRSFELFSRLTDEYKLYNN